MASTNEEGMERLLRANRVEITGQSLGYVRYLDDFSAFVETNLWDDIGGVQSRADPKVYVVQTPTALVQRCLLMASDPGDLVLDPTCGSGTTAYVAEQWGRRWITIDTSRVSLALARARIMGARYSYYFLSDSKDGQQKEAEVTRSVPSEVPTHGNIRQGFVYERVPHITLKSITNNAEIDVVWEKFQRTLEPLRTQFNAALKQNWEEWEIPREADAAWPEQAKQPHAEWWKQRIARQREIDASIAARAEFEYLYDKPYDDKRKVRVAGPFTVESLSPHRVLAVDENDELIDGASKSKNGDEQGFVQMILENLKSAVFLMKDFGKEMMGSGAGVIVNVSSVLARKSLVGSALYRASKAALEEVTRQFAFELGPRGVRVNAVAPGFIETAMTAGIEDAVKEKIRSQISLGEFGKPEAVAEAVCQLIENDYINGAVLAVDGGMIL
jgi:adenine-specific DNA-methyltransferase